MLCSTICLFLSDTLCNQLSLFCTISSSISVTMHHLQHQKLWVLLPAVVLAWHVMCRPTWQPYPIQCCTVPYRNKGGKCFQQSCCKSLSGLGLLVTLTIQKTHICRNPPDHTVMQSDSARPSSRYSKVMQTPNCYDTGLDLDLSSCMMHSGQGAQCNSASY